MATTTTTTKPHMFDYDASTLAECGIRRMTDEEYEGDFMPVPPPITTTEGATPRPGTSKTDNEAAARAASRAIWSFSQAAAAVATHNKRRITVRTEYRMGTNRKVKNALKDLETRLSRQRKLEAPLPWEVMTEADFILLKQAIENFSVRIVVHDSMTLDELKQMKAKCEIDCAAVAVEARANMMRYAQAAADVQRLSPVTARCVEFVQRSQESHTDDILDWNAALSTEILRMTVERERVPSQHAQIAKTSGITLRNILSPKTIRRRFISLNALTQAIRRDLVEFLENDVQRKDRDAVVQQIKDSCVAAKKRLH